MDEWVSGCSGRVPVGVSKMHTTSPMLSFGAGEALLGLQGTGTQHFAVYRKSSLKAPNNARPK